MLINVRVGTASKVQRLLLGSVSKYTLPAGISWVSRDIPFCYFCFYNYFLLGFTSHISLMSNRGGLMSPRLCNVMRLALGSSRFGVLHGVTGSSRLSSRLGVPRAVFRRGHGDIGMSTTSCNELWLHKFLVITFHEIL